MTIYAVHCFTEQSRGTDFPENTYRETSVERVAKILADVSRPIAGITRVVVDIVRDPVVLLEPSEPDNAAFALGVHAARAAALEVEDGLSYGQRLARETGQTGIKKW